MDVISRQIANAHTTFNIVCTLVWLPLIPLMVKIVTTIIRGDDKVQKTAFEPKYLDMKVVEQPAAAMVLVSKELNRLSELAESLLTGLKVSLTADKTSETYLHFKENLEIVQHLQESVSDYITRLFSSGNLTEQQSEYTAGLLLNRVKNNLCDASMTGYFSGIIYNIDRMADNCVGIAEEACDNVTFISLDEEANKTVAEGGAV